MNDWIVIPCGGAKTEGPNRASELYIGSMFRDALNTARQLVDDDRILILSALHGLVRLDTILEPYDVKMGDSESVTAKTLQAQARAHNLAGRVLQLLPNAYRDALETALVGFDMELVAAYAGCRGIGQQKAVLAGLRREALVAA